MSVIELSAAAAAAAVAVAIVAADVPVSLWSAMLPLLVVPLPFSSLLLMWITRGVLNPGTASSSSSFPVAVDLCKTIVGTASAVSLVAPTVGTATAARSALGVGDQMSDGTGLR